MKTAKNIEAVLFQADCPCGGAVMMKATGSFALSPGDPMVCETCREGVTFDDRKFARIA